MAVDVSLQHISHYRYDRTVNLGPQTIRLRPAPHVRGTIHKYSLKVTPKDHFINWQQDPFGNYLARIIFKEPTKEFRVEVGLVTEIRVYNPFEFFLEEAAEYFPFSYSNDRRTQLTPYLEIVDSGPFLKEFVASIDRSRKKTMDFLVEVNRLVYEMLNYLIRLEPGVQSSEETLEKGQGSCRDFAWLLCQVLRHLGLATRFVSGYLIQLKPDVKPVDGPAGPREDFTDLHAWVEVYLEGAGWVGLDGTSGLLAGEGHIPLCCTPSPLDAAPISGLIDPCEATLEHMMTVDRINEDRRITNPLTRLEWEKIQRLGEDVDKIFVKNNIQLTMGGEPTFVPADNLESESWAGKALGGGKFTRSHKLFKALQTKLATGALLHYSQGKWYPGEPLPRWSQNCIWRSDGDPIVKSNDWIIPGATGEKITVEDSLALIEEICKGINLDRKHIIPAFEDEVYHLWQERGLQVGGDQKGKEFESAKRRRALAQKMGERLGQPVGFVLPLLYSHTLNRWISSPWEFSDGRLILTPGDSPLGLRLPLGSLPYNVDGRAEIWPDRDPFANLEELPGYNAFAKTVQERRKVPALILPDYTQENAYVNIAVCVEVKDDLLSVFMPPLNYIEHYLELVAAVEAAAETLSLKLSLCGYAPPQDRRIKRFSLTPDPGVIEVNTPPASSWQELCQITETIYEEAHGQNLSASRYFLDGRRVGTGGGNHIVLGAEKPEDSPFLKNPGLLQSMLTFWQHHPSLSYLFASEFIGPTSQSPRIDEARNDSLYELEVAFQQLERESRPEPWIVDRLFRNLLIDPTGNTHRSEFCIDKMFSPQGSAGRLGLLELRAFEMPPHPKMAMLQSLLVRACVARFSERPYHHKLIRWNTRLHDQFMLPHFLWYDLMEVLDTLNEGDIQFETGWFKSFLDFRCPTWGQTQVGPMQLELRHALEPWHVMGEDIYQGSVSRAVDSSVERIQVTVSGFDERYALLCNGRRVPLQGTEIENSYVAGVRYKAWRPPSGLHPLLPINSPLVFDIVNLDDKRSIGGCTYHVVHPGGQNYDKVPINENEAEARCRSRFDALGFTAGAIEVENVVVNPHFPSTLDLRYRN